MKTHKTFIGVLGLLALLALGGCGQHSYSVAKQKYQESAEVIFNKMTDKVQVARGIAGGSYCTSCSSTTSTTNPYWGSWGNWNNQQIWIPRSSNGSSTYLRNSLDQEVAECRMRAQQVNQTSEPNFHRIRVGVFHSCLQMAMQYRNSFMTALYRNANQSTQDMWQYGSFWQYPGSQNQYQQTQPAYGFQNQYLSQGYVPVTVTYQGGY